MPHRLANSHYRVHINKEALKFSAAHMTVFADGSKERIHGHNYRTEVSFEFKDFNLANMVPFHEVKAVMKKICENWDERFFLPMLCPHLEIARHDETSFDFKLCGKRYVLPTDEVIALPVDNVTTESLAHVFNTQLVLGFTLERLKKHGITRIETTIEEIPGQGATHIQIVEGEVGA